MSRLCSQFATPNSRLVGIDLSEEAIKFARVEAEQRGNKNVSFIARDLSRFDQQAQPGTFDFITTFDAVHDQASPRNILRGIRISLADDGVYLAQDIKASSDVQHNREHPIGSRLYTISCMHCMTVSLAQGGDGLGAMWGKEMAVQYLQEARFHSVEVHELAHDFQNCRFEELIKLTWTDCQKVGEKIVALRIKGKGSVFQKKGSRVAAARLDGLRFDQAEHLHRPSQFSSAHIVTIPGNRKNC